ncbi:hypothetical protein ADIARSV_1436 [Arcticibacter svalbardensis MN12-7]|uniref:DUF4350 domain-containing protein n=1 Tax=Arcticibacter svalbardensis MN12-7 TaxID=1150600 RepID=R9GV81_9SPHI|nr:DUF4350 domain-containing protein [Arcticibacter svalbardensis]EOR95435.1 hypothetical protein ADIARSV_1436 [Arcticibacter svalbardensis MN12-7]
MKGYKLYLFCASLFLTVYLLAEYNRPKNIDWTTTFKYTDNNPFGTYVLYNRLNDIFPAAIIAKTNKSAYEVFTDSSLKPGNYIIIAETANIGKADFKKMITYIAAGNSIFISALNWDGFLADSLKIKNGIEFNKEKTGVNFTNKLLKHPKAYKFDKFTSNQYFDKFDTRKATVISQNQFGHSNYLSFKFGKGNLYVFANPQLLTNYTLLKPKGADYAAKVLSYMPVAKYVYWDQYQNSGNEEDASSMRVFFKYPALKWAFYISVISLLLFVIYEVKRRQRIIPVIEPLKNSTVEFVSVVGNVYYEQRDNTNIASKKIVYFAEHLRSVFGLKTGIYNKEFLVGFTNKTGIDESLAKELLNHINYLGHQTAVTDDELIILNQLIEKFYIQSGSYGK